MGWSLGSDQAGESLLTAARWEETRNGTGPRRTESARTGLERKGTQKAVHQITSLGCGDGRLAQATMTRRSGKQKDGFLAVG